MPWKTADGKYLKEGRSWTDSNGIKRHFSNLKSLYTLGCSLPESDDKSGGLRPPFKDDCFNTSWKIKKETKDRNTSYNAVLELQEPTIIIPAGGGESKSGGGGESKSETIELPPVPSTELVFDQELFTTGPLMLELSYLLSLKPPNQVIAGNAAGQWTGFINRGFQHYQNSRLLCPNVTEKIRGTHCIDIKAVRVPKRIRDKLIEHEKKKGTIL